MSDLSSMFTTRGPGSSLDNVVASGKLIIQSGRRWAQIDGTAALWGPVQGGDLLSHGTPILIGIDQESVPYVIWPSPPDEVSQAELDAALALVSANTASITSNTTRIAALEARMNGYRAPVVYSVSGTGDTATLGSSYQDMPGLSQALTLAIGDIVLMDAFVRLVWPNNTSWPTAHFTIIEPDAVEQYRTPGSQLALYGVTVGTNGGAVVPVTGQFVATKTGNHTFKVQATNQGTGGGGKGIGTGGYSRMRVVRLGVL